MLVFLGIQLIIIISGYLVAHNRKESGDFLTIAIVTFIVVLLSGGLWASYFLHYAMDNLH